MYIWPAVCSNGIIISNILSKTGVMTQHAIKTPRASIILIEKIGLNVERRD